MLAMPKKKEKKNTQETNGALSQTLKAQRAYLIEELATFGTVGDGIQVSPLCSSSLMYLTKDFLCTIPAYCPSLNTQMYRNPNLTKH